MSGYAYKVPEVGYSSKRTGSDLPGRYSGDKWLMLLHCATAFEPILCQYDADWPLRIIVKDEDGSVLADGIVGKTDGIFHWIRRKTCYARLDGKGAWVLFESEHEIGGHGNNNDAFRAIESVAPGAFKTKERTMQVSDDVREGKGRSSEITINPSLRAPLDPIRKAIAALASALAADRRDEVDFLLSAARRAAGLCRECNGSGRLGLAKCSACDGTGRAR